MIGIEMTPITSRHNHHIQQWLAWQKSPAAARADGVLLVEGEHSILAGVHCGFRIRRLWVDDSLPLESWPSPLRALMPQPNLVLSCSRLLLNQISSLNTVEAPWLAVFDYPQPHTFPAHNDDVVVLDGVQDPGNVGTVLRTCAVFGVPWVYALQGTASAWHSKVVRAGQGAHFQINVREALAREAIPHLHSHDWQGAVINIASAQGEAATQVDLAGRQIWVFGHEGRGVGDEFYALPHRVVAIPMLGHMDGALDSLNVAQSASILLYEAMRQRM